MGNKLQTEQSGSIQESPLTSTSDMLFVDGMIDKLERFSTLMSKGRATVPGHLVGSPSDCMAVVMQAAQWKMNPFAVAQKTHLVHGILGYEAQLVNAVITTMAPTKDRLHFEWFGDWSNVIGKFIEKSGKNGSTYTAPNWSLKDEEGCGVRVWATLKGESDPRELVLLLSQAIVRNSTLWASDPKQQLAYLAIKRWSRLYTPDVIMGVYTPDELMEIEPRDMGEAEVISAEPEPLPEYTQDNFNKNFDKWASAIKDGKKTPDQIIATISSKYTLTDEQVASIHDAGESS